MKVLALDLASSMGVAVGVSGCPPKTTTIHLGKGSEDARFSRLLTVVAKLLAEHQPDLVAIEAAVGGPKTSHYLVGLSACARGVCFNRGVRVELCNIATVRRHFLGKHLTMKHFPGKNAAAAKKAIKAQVIARCGLLGWHVESDDEADAAATFSFASSTWGKAQAAPLGGLFSGACADNHGSRKKDRPVAGVQPRTGLNATPSA